MCTCMGIEGNLDFSYHCRGGSRSTSSQSMARSSRVEISSENPCICREGSQKAGFWGAPLCRPSRRTPSPPNLSCCMIDNNAKERSKDGTEVIVRVGRPRRTGESGQRQGEREWGEKDGAVDGSVLWVGLDRQETQSQAETPAYHAPPHPSHALITRPTLTKVSRIFHSD